MTEKPPTPEKMSLRQRKTTKNVEVPSQQIEEVLIPQTKLTGILKKATTNRPPTPRMSLKDIRNMSLDDDDDEEEESPIKLVLPPTPPKMNARFIEDDDGEVMDLSYGFLSLKLTETGKKIEKANKNSSQLISIKKFEEDDQIRKFKCYDEARLFT